MDRQNVVDLTKVIVKIEENVSILSEVIEIDSDEEVCEEEVKFIKAERHVEEPTDSVISFCCVKCGAVADTKNSLRTYYDKNLPEFVCNKCVKRKKKNDYICKKCKCVFSRKSRLKNHVKSVHRRIKDYSCDMCNEVFLERDLLEEHVEFAHGHGQLNQFVCAECGRAFKFEHQLNNHIETRPSKLRRFACSQCCCAFTIKHNLTLHINNVHLKIRYKCRHCNSSFSQRGSMVRHKRAHHDDT